MRFGLGWGRSGSEFATACGRMPESLRHDLVAPNVDEMELTILKGCVKDAVEALDESYRDVYLMCEIEERTVEEAAAALGLTVAAAKSRLLRARAKVREMLDHSICAT